MKAKPVRPAPQRTALHIKPILLGLTRQLNRRADRQAALRFLRRALREAERKRGLRSGLLTSVQKAALWRVVVAASHKSGRFER